MTKRLLLCLTAVTLLNATAQASDPKINYTDHVRAIFRDKCFSCHNTNKKAAGLDLSSFSALMQGGASGEAIEPGSAEDSYLFMLVTHESEPKMPPNSDRLPDPMLDTIRKWIEAGAPETSSSKVMLPKKPKVDLNVSVDAGARPEGPAPLPDVLNLEPVVHTPTTTATSAIATSPWAPVVAIAGQTQVVLYHTETQQPLGVLPFPEGQVRVLKFSRNGSLLLAGGGLGGSRGLAVVWNIRTGERVFEVGDELDEVLAADISADHEFVALAGPQKIVRVYNTGSGELAWEVPKKHTDWILSLEFSPDAVLLATGDRSSGLHVWETYTGRPYATLNGHKGAVTGLSWRIDSNVLASCSEDSTIKLWEMEGGKAIKSWKAHDSGNTSVEFCRDGRVVSSGRDKTAKMWDQNGKGLHTYYAFDDLALRVSHCDETDRVIAGDWAGTIRCYNAADGARLGELSSNPPMLAARLQTVQGQLPAATDAQAKAKAAKDQAVAAHKAEADKLAASQATLKTAQDAIAALEKAKATQEPELNAAKAKLKQLQDAVAVMDGALPKLKAAADSAAAAAQALPDDKALSDMAAKVAGELKTRSDSTAKQKADLAATQEDVTKRDAAFQKVLADLKQNQATATTADQAVKTSTAALEPLKKNLDQTTQASAAADSALAALQEESNRWQQYIALRDELAALQQQQTATDAKQLAKLEAEAVLNEHQQKIGASEQQMAAHQKTMTDQQQLAADLQNKINGGNQTIQQQTELVNKHNQVLPALDAALKQAQAALAVLPEDAQIKASIDAVNAAIAAKKESLTVHQQAIVTAQEAVKADTTAMTTAQQTAATAQQNMQAEQKNLAGLQEARKPLAAGVEAAAGEFQAAEAALQKARETVEARRAQLRPAIQVTQN